MHYLTIHIYAVPNDEKISAFKKKTQIDTKFIYHFVLNDFAASMTKYVQKFQNTLLSNILVLLPTSDTTLNVFSIFLPLQYRKHPEKMLP